MSGKESHGGLASSTFRLNLGDPQGTLPAHNHESIGVGPDNLAGDAFRGRIGKRCGGVDLQQSGGASDEDGAEGPGPRGEGTEPAPKMERRLRPVDPAVVAGDLPGVRDAFHRLGNGRELTRDPCRKMIHHQIPTELRQTVVQDPGIVGVVDGCAEGGDHRAGIEPGFHAHQADTRFGITTGDGPLDGCGTAPPGEQGRVDVETSVPGNVEKGRGKDLAVGGDHDDIGCEGAKGIQEVGVAGTVRLEHGNAAEKSLDLDGWRGQLEMTADRTIRLGDRGEDVESGMIGDAPEYGPGKVRCSHENQADPVWHRGAHRGNRHRTGSRAVWIRRNGW